MGLLRERERDTCAQKYVQYKLESNLKRESEYDSRTQEWLVSNRRASFHFNAIFVRKPMRENNLHLLPPMAEPPQLSGNRPWMPGEICECGSIAILFAQHPVMNGVCVWAGRGSREGGREKKARVYVIKDEEYLRTDGEGETKRILCACTLLPPILGPIAAHHSYVWCTASHCQRK